MDAVKDFFMHRATVPEGRNYPCFSSPEGVAWIYILQKPRFTPVLHLAILRITTPLLFFS